MVSPAPDSERVAAVSAGLLFPSQTVAAPLPRMEIQPAAPDDHVVAAPAVQAILPASPHQGVGATPAVYDIRTLPGEDLVLPTEPTDHVRLRSTSDVVIVPGRASDGAVQSLRSGIGVWLDRLLSVKHQQSNHIDDCSKDHHATPRPASVRPGS
jgi:hypothetical protein